MEGPQVLSGSRPTCPKILKGPFAAVSSDSDGQLQHFTAKCCTMTFKLLAYEGHQEQTGVHPTGYFPIFYSPLAQGLLWIAVSLEHPLSSVHTVA